MPSTLTRRPLPALISLVALLLLTALVWWRVLHRNTSTGAAKPCPTPTTAAATATLPAPAKVRVQVLNSTTRSGIAGKARSALVADGFDSPNAAANDKKTVHVKGVAEIRYGPSGLASAKLLRYYFPGATLVATTSTNPTVVVSLGALYKAVAKPAAVQAALKADRVAVSSPSPTSPSGSTPGSAASSGSPC